MYAVAQPTSFPASAGIGGNSSNSYFGDQAGLVNTGVNNTFIGASSGFNCTLGNANTFVGTFAGFSTTIGLNNTFIGFNSGALNVDGSSNIFIGSSSGINNLSGSSNVFVGILSGLNNSTGNDNIFIGANSGTFNTIGERNTFVGTGSGRDNVTGNDNVFVGFEAGERTTSSENVFVGFHSGWLNTTGFRNTFIGFESGGANTTGVNNTFIGRSSGTFNTTGSSNTFGGASSGSFNTIGTANTFYGFSTGSQNDEGSHNTFIGNQAGVDNTNGFGNVFVGSEAGFNNATGYGNTFLGTASGENSTTGINNTYLGRFAGRNSVNGSGNVFIGTNAGQGELGSDLLYISNSETNNPLVWGNFSSSLIHFNASVGIGLDPSAGVLPTADFDLDGTARFRSLAENETLTRILVSDSDGNISWKDEESFSAVSDNLGNHQVEQDLIPTSDGTFDLGEAGNSLNNLFLAGAMFLDNEIIIHNTNGNVAFGPNSLNQITTGTNNVSVGRNTSQSTTTGSNNVSLGWNSLNWNTTGSSNTAIGYATGPTFSLNTMNSTSIGNQARASSNAVRVGNSSVTSIGGFAAWTNLSDGRFKDVENSPTPGLEYVMALRPVSYTLKREALHQHLREEGSLTTTDNQRHFGFVAQEVLDLDRRLSLGSAIVDVPETEEGVYGIRYDELTAIYAKSIQELTTMVKEQKSEIDELKSLFVELLNKPVSNQVTQQAASSVLDGVILGDINPNPFDQSARISVTLPNQISNAMLIISDLQGGLLKEYRIQRSGETVVNVDKSDLDGSGIYLYSLVVNGSVFNTKRMLLR